MTDSINNGGPAFPVATDEHVVSIGMTLRDWFAGQALAGEMTIWGAGIDGHEFNIARRAYAMADAMLEARK